jgi:hypothetical protein
MWLRLRVISIPLSKTPPTPIKTRNQLPVHVDWMIKPFGAKSVRSKGSGSDQVACVRPCDAAGWGRWPRSGFGEQALNPVDIGTHALAEFRNFYSAPIMRLKYALKN